MNEIIPGLVNLGLGGLMAAALVWFLYHLISRTLPEMNRTFRKDILVERKLRFREYRRLVEMMDRQATHQLEMMDSLGKQQQEQHEALLTHVDTSLKELGRLFTEGLSALEHHLGTQSVGANPKQGPRSR